MPAILGVKGIEGWELWELMAEPTCKTTSNPVWLDGVDNREDFIWRGRPLLLNADPNPQEEGGLGVGAEVTSWSCQVSWDLKQIL